MPTFQPGMVADEYNITFDKYPRCFMVAAGITLIDIVFIICCSFVYTKEYIFVVKNTLNETTNSYTVTRPFIILYLWESICALLITLWLIVLIIWLLINVIC